MSSSRLFAAAITSTALVALGCSSTTAYGTPSDAVAGDTKLDAASRVDSGRSDTGRTDTGGPTPTDTGSGDLCATKADCTACADYETCATCLEDTDTPGVEALNQVFINGCGCTAGAACSTQCATGCSSGTLDSTCVGCLNGLTGSEACFDKVRTDCAANADCTRFVNALQGCPE